MTLTDRLAARGLSADYKPIRGAEAFMAGELDDAHLLAEHRALAETYKELRQEWLRVCADLIHARAENERLRSLLPGALVGERECVRCGAWLGTSEVVKCADCEMGST